MIGSFFVEHAENAISIVWRLCDLQKDSAGIPHTVGISLYRDRLYGNLYVMPIYDVQNHV